MKPEASLDQFALHNPANTSSVGRHPTGLWVCLHQRFVHEREKVLGPDWRVMLYSQDVRGIRFERIVLEDWELFKRHAGGNGPAGLYLREVSTRLHWGCDHNVLLV